MRKKEINEKEKEITMSTKPTPVLADKDIKKDLLKKEVGPKNQRYVRAEKVKVMESKGWKVIPPKKDKHNRTLGIKANASDLVLMEK